MEHFKIKWKVILVPYIKIVVAYLLIYSLLHYLIVLKPLLDVREDVVRFFIPIGLSWVPLTIWWRRRLKLLQFKKQNGAFGIILLASIAMGVATGFAQRYVVSATGKLTVLNVVDDLPKFPKTQYYQLRQSYIDQQHPGFRTTYTITGKHNTDYNMWLYIVMPVYANASDTAKEACSYFLEAHFKETISNRLSQAEKDEAFEAFTARSWQEFHNTDYSKHTYLQVLGNNDRRDELLQTIKSTQLIRYRDPVLFQPRFNAFSERMGNDLQEAIGVFLVAVAIVLLIVAFTPLKPEATELIEGLRSINSPF